MSTLQEKSQVMVAAANGADIEVYTADGKWHLAVCPLWNWDKFAYRVRVVTRKVNFLAYRSDAGELCWFASGCLRPGIWTRVPSEDKEVEVQE